MFRVETRWKSIHIVGECEIGTAKACHATNEFLQLIKFCSSPPIARTPASAAPPPPLCHQRYCRVTEIFQVETRLKYKVIRSDRIIGLMSGQHET